MKISDISPQKHNPKRVNIYLDGQFAFGLSNELRFEKRLEIDQDISEQKTEELITEDQTRRLLEKAYHFLSYRPRSEKEIRDHLGRKGSLTDLEKSSLELQKYQSSLDVVIAKLQKNGQIDDLEFARWWVEQRTRFNPRGTRLLKLELKQKGVKSEVIQESLNSFKESSDTSSTSETSLAFKAAQKKMSSYQKLSYLEFKQKMGRFLLSRGFGWETIESVIDTLSKKS